MFSTYAIVKPSHMLDSNASEFMAFYISDNDYSTEVNSGVVNSTFAMKVFNEAWSWVKWAGIGTQGIRIATGDNVICYVLAGEPNAKFQRTQDLLMIESINPQKNGLLNNLEIEIIENI